MSLPTSLERLNISGSPHPHNPILNIDSNGQLFLEGEHQGLFHQEVEALNRLKNFNEGKDLNFDEESLTQMVKFFGALDVAENEELEKFWIVLSLVIASYKLNDLIRKDMNVNLVEEIISHYFQILEVFRSIEYPLDHSILLSKCSFISPLLITISFSFKLNHSKSNEIIKLLTVLFNYLLVNENTLLEFKRLFEVNSSTNMEVFEVFNKLWEKTLERTENMMKLNEKYQPGPITIISRLKTLNSEPITYNLLNQIIPFTPNSFLQNSSKEVVFIVSQLTSLKTKSLSLIGLKNVFSNLIPYLSTSHGTELIFTLIRSLKLDELLLKLHEDEELSSIIHYFFFKFSGISVFSGPLSATRYIHEIISSDLVEVIEISREAGYKVLFEVIDHNYKTELLNDFQLTLALELSLSALNESFDFPKECYILTDLGSSFSIEAILNYTTSICQNSLIYSINPRASFPAQFKDIMQLNKFPPLPKSYFLDFSVEGISPKFLNLNNFQRLIKIIQLSNELIQKVLEFKYLHKESFDLTDKGDGTYSNFAFSTSNALLEQYFTVLYSNFIISTELLLKSGNIYSPHPVFFDLASIGNFLKLQTFHTLELIFKLYGTFAIFSLLKFTNSISYQNLELQRLSLIFLNHLIFHSTTTDIKDIILSDDLLKKMLVDYVIEWDNGTDVIYENLSNFLGIESKQKSETTIKLHSFLKILGFENPSPGFSPAPSSTGSTGSNFNSSYNNFYSGNTTITSQTLSSQGNPTLNNNHNNRFQNPVKNMVGNENNGLSLNQRNMSSKNIFNNTQSTDTSEGYNQIHGVYNYSTSTGNTTGLSDQSGFANINNKFHDIQPFVSQYQQQSHVPPNNNNLNNQTNNFYKNN